LYINAAISFPIPVKPGPISTVSITIFLLSINLRIFLTIPCVILRSDRGIIVVYGDINAIRLMIFSGAATYIESRPQYSAVLRDSMSGDTWILLPPIINSLPLSPKFGDGSIFGFSDLTRL